MGSRARGPCVTFSISGFSRKGQHLLSSHVTGTQWEDTVRDFISLECSTTGGSTKPWVSSFHVISYHESKHPPRELESGKYAHSPTLAFPLIYRDSTERPLNGGEPAPFLFTISVLLRGQGFSHLPGNQANVQVPESHERSRSSIRAKPLTSATQASQAPVLHHRKEH